MQTFTKNTTEEDAYKEKDAYREKVCATFRNPPPTRAERMQALEALYTRLKIKQ